MTPSKSRMLARLGWVFSGFLCLDVLFWSLADFDKFMPPSPGLWQERLDWMLLTALGPISTTRIEAIGINGWMLSAAIALVAISAIRWRHLTWLRGVAYGGIVTWWFVGFCYGAIRIT